MIHIPCAGKVKALDVNVNPCLIFISGTIFQVQYVSFGSSLDHLVLKNVT